MEAESVDPDWVTGKKAIRIFSMCDQSLQLDKDETRTEFHWPHEIAVQEWNRMNA